MSEVGNLFEFVEEPASSEFLQSLSSWPEFARQNHRE
jgi:hypothetical protein